MKNWKPSVRYSKKYVEIKKADTTRFCGRCRSFTTWKYDPAVRHSRCGTCRGALGFTSEEAFERHLARARQ